MRGKRSYVSGLKLEYRITPADAGKTKIIDDYFTHYGDHPRGCGENEFLSKRLLVDSGSPPRMRGKLATIFANLLKYRITPADAGKTITSPR